MQYSSTVQRQTYLMFKTSVRSFWEGTLALCKAIWKTYSANSVFNRMAQEVLCDVYMCVSVYVSVCVGECLRVRVAEILCRLKIKFQTCFAEAPNGENTIMTMGC